jgi:hypothetical protein
MAEHSITQGGKRSTGVRALFSFPEVVNETSARLVAAGVVLQGLLFLVIRQWWVLAVLAVGFLLRVLAGPRFSPLGRLVTQVITPRVAGPHAMVPGAPKRFAQAVGLTFSASALVAELAGAHTVAVVLMVGLVMAATLESLLALCLGCVAFSKLMSWGVIPESVCESCADISLHLSRRLETQSS